MLLKNKKILIMGIRNKWSIAFGIAKSAYENGAELIFTYMGEENKEKIEELISEFEGSKAYVLNGASEDEMVKEVFEKIKSIVVDQLGVSEENVTEEATFVDDLAADSLDIVELIMRIEEEFDMEIPDADAEKIVTVGDVVNYIKENK